jgi:hypothetical protein
MSIPGIFGSIVGVGVAGGVAAAAPLQAETSKANPIIIEKILKRFMIVRVTPLSKVNVMKWTVSDIGYSLPAQ